MNNTDTTALQTVSKLETAEVPRAAASALMMDVATMESLMRVADLMASGKSTVPVHLQKNPADCMAIVMQSMQWGMNPFAVAQKTHVVNGTLGYEAQLVNAVVQASGAIEGQFHFEFKGAAGAIECRVGAVLRGEKEVTWGEWLCENKVTTKNSPLWKTNPKQQLAYLQTKNWSRLHTPGAILGVYTPDELDTLPRDMGVAEVVQSAPAGPSSELQAAARTAAAGGRIAFQRWFKTVSEDQRASLGPMRPELQLIWEKADSARTVDNPAPAPAPAAAPAAPAGKTFDEVMAMLCAAKTEDALFVAGEWIEAIAEDDGRAVLQDKFDERLGQVQGAAA